MIRISILYLILFTSNLLAQVENIPLSHDVYLFIHNMKVKGLIDKIHYDDRIKSRSEIESFINSVLEKKNELTTTELKIAEKYKIEFSDQKFLTDNTIRVFGDNRSIGEVITDFFSNKMKQIYFYKNNDISINFGGDFFQKHGQFYDEEMNNVEFYGMNLRFYGSLTNSFGFFLNVNPEFISGARYLAPEVDPSVLSNIKYLNDQERASSKADTEGYIRWIVEPVKNMNIAFQIGRERITFGYGYNYPILISGYGPIMDMVKLNFNYGVASFHYIHGTTSGSYVEGNASNYSKHISTHKLKFTFPGAAEFSIGESIIYGKRGIELGYLNPFGFYKYVEQGMQDRDNGLFFLDFQSDFIENFEFHGILLMDETIDLLKFQKFHNKIGIQTGFYWYSPFSFNDSYVTFEYTMFRPYVFTHTFEQNSYTGFDVPLSHPMGPNSEEYYFNFGYLFSPSIRNENFFVFRRAGDNILDENGNVTKNVGGDILVPHNLTNDSEDAPFLDGIRTDELIVGTFWRFEIFREIFLDAELQYQKIINQSFEGSNDKFFGRFRFVINY